MKFFSKSFALTLLLATGVTFAQPIPSQLKPGDVIPEMVWKNRTIKKNVRIINLIAGRVILKPEGSSTEQFRLDEFQKLVQLTNTSLEKIRAEIEEKRRLQEAAAAAAVNKSPPLDSPPTQLSSKNTSPISSVIDPNLSVVRDVKSSVSRDANNSLGAPKLLPPKGKFNPPSSANDNPFSRQTDMGLPSNSLQASHTSSPSPKSGNPFGTPMQDPSLAESPTVVPSPAPLPNLSPPADTPSPALVPTPVPALVPTPVPASPFAPSTVNTPSTLIRPVQPVSLSEPQEMKILRESIHGRIEQLQGEYLTSLSRLKGEYQARGDSAAADYVDQSIASVEHQTQELSRLLKSGDTRSRKLGRSTRSIPEKVSNISAPSPQPISSVPALKPLPSIPKPSTPLPVDTVTAASTRSRVPGQPEQIADGQVPVVVKSILGGAQPGLTMNRVEKWSQIKQERIEGRPYWTVEVDYMADSIFGNFPARAKALIERGQVVKWISAPRD